MVALEKEKTSHSFLDNKRQKLLDELSELMDKAGGEYGPFFMEKLHARLDLVVKNFNEELKSLIDESFNRWKIKDRQLRDLIGNNLKAPQREQFRKKTKKSSTPNFLKDIEFGPIHNK